MRTKMQEKIENMFENKIWNKHCFFPVDVLYYELIEQKQQVSDKTDVLIW